MEAIDFSQLTPVQIRYLSLGIKAFTDRFVGLSLGRIPNVTISIPIYDFSSIALLFNSKIRDSITCIPVEGSVAVTMTIDDANYVDDPVHGQIFGFDLMYSYSVSPAGVIDVRIDTLARKYIGGGFKVDYETLTDVVYAASLEIFKVKLAANNIVELPTPIASNQDPNASKSAQFIIAEGMTYGQVFASILTFCDTALTNFKLRYVTPYI